MRVARFLQLGWTFLSGTSALAVPSPAAEAARKLLICSDSTTMPYGATSLIQGWGFYMHNYFNLNITNLARGGRSTRSFINEGLWASLLTNVIPGERTFVLIEMGHNDNGNPSTDVKNRATLPGIGEETIMVSSNATGGTSETVFTFGHYLRKMITDVREKGGVPVLSGMVPVMNWTDGVLRKQWDFADYEKQVAEQEHVEYIDHTKYSVERWQAFGSLNATFPYYPLNDSTHTSWDGALINAEAFVTAVKCNIINRHKSQLAWFLNDNAISIKDSC